MDSTLCVLKKHSVTIKEALIILKGLKSKQLGNAKKLSCCTLGRFLFTAYLWEESNCPLSNLIR